jgi:hypothetical protein
MLVPSPPTANTIAATVTSFVFVLIKHAGHDFPPHGSKLTPIFVLRRFHSFPNQSHQGKHIWSLVRHYTLIFEPTEPAGGRASGALFAADSENTKPKLTNPESLTFGQTAGRVVEATPLGGVRVGLLVSVTFGRKVLVRRRAAQQ